MKKTIIFTLIVALICASFAYAVFLTGEKSGANPDTVLAEGIGTEIVLQVDNPIMTGPDCRYALFRKVLDLMQSGIRQNKRL